MSNREKIMSYSSKIDEIRLSLENLPIEALVDLDCWDVLVNIEEKIALLAEDCKK